MNYYGIIPLHFLTPVHFGDAGEGGGLEDVYTNGKADTLFSALYIEALQHDAQKANELYEKTEKGDLLISDLFPWAKIDDEYSFYLPKPNISMQGVTSRQEKNWEEAKKELSLRKKNKKQLFIRASQLSFYVGSLFQGNTYEFDQITIGEIFISAHLNSRTKKPYTVGAYSFSENSGLYMIIAAKEEKDLYQMELLIKLLGYSGIGGRRSSGLGKFEEADDMLLLEGDEILGKDDISLYRMLSDDTASMQMSLSCYLPTSEEWEDAESGKGNWLKRGGFAYDEENKVVRKVNSVYMMNAGACFSKRLNGRIADVTVEGLAHPVYKYGKGLFAGIEVRKDEI